MSVAGKLHVIESPYVHVEVGLELLDSDDKLIEDITTDLMGGSLRRSNFARVHGTLEVDITKELQWTNQRLKPYMTLACMDCGHEELFSELGIYLPTTPKRTTGETPETFRVTAYDKIYMLDTIRRGSYSVSAGTSYVEAVETLLDEIGEPHSINPDAIAKTLSTTRVWQLDEKNTNLAIINDLLSAIGYRGLWCDQTGRFRSEPWESPVTRATTYDYLADTTASILNPGADLTRDLHEIPNVAVFIRDDPDPGASIPIEGNGIYIKTNQSSSATSIDERGREVVAGPFRVDVADQESLERYGDRRFEVMTQPKEYLDVVTGPNLLQWHADVVRLTWSLLGYNLRRFTVINWELSFNDFQMKQSWSLT
jgi:hypothetical protein